MLTTADSALISFSTMWLRDFYLPYIKPAASAREQLIFTRCMTVVGLAIGLFLTSMSIRTEEVWNLSNLFSLQTVTPIHVAPAVWLGLHWKGLRGEAVLAGMLVGLGVTFGFTFSELNVKLKLGLDETKEGWSCAVIGLCCNLLATVALGLLFEHGTQLPNGPLAEYARPMDIHGIFGQKLDRLCHPGLWAVMCSLIAFTTPFYRSFGEPDTFVGSMASWAFISLAVSGVITVIVAAAYMYLWTEYDLPKEPSRYPAANDAPPETVDDEKGPQPYQMAPVYTMMAPPEALGTLQPMPPMQMPMPMPMPMPQVPVSRPCAPPSALATSRATCCAVICPRIS